MKHPHGHVKRFHGLAEAAAFLGLLFTLAGSLDRFHWVFECFTHYKPLLALCFLIYAVIEWLLRSKRIAGISLLAAAFNAWPVAHLRFSATLPARLPPGRVTHLRLLQANLLTSNTNSAALLRLIANEAPDAVVLQEPSARWLQTLAPLTNTYPVYAALPRPDNFGAAIFCKSRADFAATLLLPEHGGAPLTHARFTRNGRTLTLIGVHAYAPYNREHWHKRNQFTETLAGTLRAMPGAVVVTGDFNNTPWSFHFQHFLAQSGLVDSARGRGHLTTWPTTTPIMRIPLDHCLHTPTVRILKRRRGPDIGSDHFPLIIDLAF